MSQSIQKCEITLDGKVVWAGVNEIVVGPITKINFDGGSNEVSILIEHRDLENGK